MRKIISFKDSLAYYSRLGLVTNDRSVGWIPYYQQQLCNLINAVESGFEQWAGETFKYPYFVKYRKNLSHTSSKFGKILTFDIVAIDASGDGTSHRQVYTAESSLKRVVPKFDSGGSSLTWEPYVAPERALR